MATHSKPIGRHVLVAIALALGGQVALGQSLHPQRVISIVPSVTEILFAIGAAPQVIGIGSFDQIPSGHPNRDNIARVGGLLDPDMERILTLRPDLVVLYRSQADPKQQLARAGIAVLPYEHGSLADVSNTIRSLGQRTGHVAEAEALATRVEAGLAAIRARVAGRPRPRTLLVFSREPSALRNVYASGGIGFLHDMLDVAGGDNVFRHVRSERVAQVSSEAILTAAPDVIIEIRYEGELSPGTIDDERAVWQKLSTVPAARTGRIHFVSGNRFVVPGPRVAEATEQLARVLHPDAF